MKKNIFLFLAGVLCICANYNAATITSNAVTGNWNSASTWVGGVIPGINDSVVIVNGANITLNVNATVYKLKINTGGILNIGSYTLTLNGNGILGGNLDIYGTLNLNTGIIQLTGDFVLSGTFNCGTGTVTFNGNDAQRMLGNVPTFYHLRSANTNNALGKGVSLHQTNTIIKGNFIADGVFARNSQSYPNATVTFDGVDSLYGAYSFYLNHVVINSGAILKAGYKTIYLYGNWTSNGTFVCNYSQIVVKYDTYSSVQPNNQTIYVANPAQNPFWNLTVDKSQGKVSPIEGTNNSLGHIYVLNNFSINAGTWDVNGTRQLYVGKNFTCSGTGTFLASQGRVIMNGTDASTPQLLSPGNNSLYKLTINNSGAGVRLGSNVTVTYELNLTNGVVYTRNGNNHFELYLSNSDVATSLTAYSANSFVAGKLKRAIGNNTYIFPVGVSNCILKKYRPIEFVFTNSTGTNWVLVNLDSIENSGTYYASYWATIQPDNANPAGTARFSYHLTQDFQTGMQECIISVMRGTMPPNPQWNYVLTTSVPASGGTNGFITVQLPATYAPYAYILGEPVPTINPATICDGNSANLTIASPTGYGNFYWYTTPSGGTYMHTGNAYTTPILYDTTTYFIAYFNPQCVGNRYPNTVNVNDIPSAAFTIQNPICSGNNAVVTYTGTPIAGSAYSWNFGGASANPGTGIGPHTITGVAGNNYQISLQVSANGCTSNVNVQQVYFPLPLQVAINKTDASCGNNNGTASANVSGGLSPFSYAWSNGANTQAINNLPAGNYMLTVTDALGCTATSSVNISNIGAPTVSTYIQNHVRCYGEHNGKATVSATGTGLLNYQWSNGVSGSGNNSISSTIDTLSAGLYTITVTDQNNCMTIVSLTIQQPQPLVASYQSSNITCHGLTNGSILMQPTGGTPNYTYSWAHGSSSSSQTMLAAGTYTVTVTDANNCSTVQNIQIAEPLPLSVTMIRQNVTCFGQQNGTLNAQVSGGTPPYSYLWNTGSTSASISNLAAGVYVLNVTDANGCSSAFTDTINQPAPINLSFVSSNISCAGLNDGSVEVNVTGGILPYQYLWSNGSTSQNNSSLSAGTYSVTVSDANGCTSVGTQTIFEPSPLIVTLSSNSVSCFGQNNGSVLVNIQGGVTPYTILWSNGSTLPILSNLPGGTYSVTVTDANGCSSVQSVVVNEPNAIQVNYNIQHVLCNGQQNGSISLQVSGGSMPYQFLWNTGSHSQNLYNLASGTYAVTITDNNGCTNTQAFVVAQPTAMTLSKDYSQYLCGNENSGYIQLNVSGGTPAYVYTWNNGSTNSSLSNLTGGKYTVTITDVNGCSIVDTTDIIYSNLVSATILYDMQTHYASVAIVGGVHPFTYLWNNATTDSMVYVSQSGNYSVTITDAAGCTVIASSDISAEVIIPTLITPNGDGVNDYFEIKGIEMFSEVTIEIYNRWNQRLFYFNGSGIEYKDQNKQWNAKYEGKELPLGTYLFIVNLHNDKDPIIGNVSIKR